MNRLLNLDRTSRVVWSLVAITAIPAIGTIDLASGAEFTFSLIYLMPAIVLAWTQGARGGLLASLGSGAMWLYVDFAADRYTYSVAAYLWNFFSRLMVQTLLSVLVAALRTSLIHQYQLARTDPLTRLLNPRAFHEALLLESNRARRYGRPLTVAYFDLDNFKSVNDREGHPAGDELLRQFAQSVSSQVRTSDVVARLGGDEFAVLFAECDAEAARTAVAKIQHAAAMTFRQRYPVTVSIGVVTYRTPPESADVIVEQADRLMYRVKSSGKNASEFVVD